MVTAGLRIPDLERLLREVLRLVIEANKGSSWLDNIPSSARRALDAANARAADQRPAEVRRDDWESAGLAEMATTVRGLWSDIHADLAPIWTRQDEFDVDIRRLASHRGRAVHVVNSPQLDVAAPEIDGTIQRIRVGLETIRRHLSDKHGDWHPYIESVSSNVPGLSATRSAPYGDRPTLNEGDLVMIEILGVNPLGASENLRYSLLLHWNGGASEAGWQKEPRFEMTVPRTRSASFHPLVAAESDLDNRDEWVLSFNIRPTEATQP